MDLPNELPEVESFRVRGCQSNLLEPTQKKKKKKQFKTQRTLMV